MADVLEMISRVIDLDVVFCKPSNKRGGGGGPGMVWPLEEDVSFGKVKGVTARCFRCEKAERSTHAHACVALVLLYLYFCYDRICDAFFEVFYIQSATIDDPPEPSFVDLALGLKAGGGLSALTGFHGDVPSCCHPPSDCGCRRGLDLSLPRFPPSVLFCSRRT